MLVIDPRLTDAEAAAEQARHQVLAIRNSPNSDPDTVAALSHLSMAIDKILLVLRDWDSKVNK